LTYRILFVSSFLDVIENYVTKFLEVLYSLVNAMYMFSVKLEEVEARLDAMADSVNGGTIYGYSGLEVIGTYRYLVGDSIFMLTYLIVLIGILFTLYKLVIMAVKVYNNAKSGGSLTSFSKLFK